MHGAFILRMDSCLFLVEIIKINYNDDNDDNNDHNNNDNDKQSIQLVRTKSQFASNFVVSPC